MTKPTRNGLKKDSGKMRGGDRDVLTAILGAIKEDRKRTIHFENGKKVETWGNTIRVYGN